MIIYCRKKQALSISLHILKSKVGLGRVIISVCFKRFPLFSNTICFAMFADDIGKFYLQRKTIPKMFAHLKKKKLNKKQL